jgi:two-component system, OmpR family, response regulator
MRTAASYGSATPMTGNTAIHILVVDDEPEIRSVLRRGLESAGYAVHEAGGRAELLERLKTTPINLITLDLSLGAEDGLQAAREIRAMRNVPIMMITGRSTPIDRVAGLEHGADDYISKPFHIREVLMRVRTVLRRYELEGGAAESGRTNESDAERYAFEAGVLDAKRRELLAPDGEQVQLTDAEFALLLLFLRQPTRVLSRDEITARLKGHSWSPLDRTIDGHIARLRKKIEPGNETPRLIKSVRGVGYVFTGDARRR